MTEFQSLIFYLFIIFISCLIAKLAQQERVKVYYKNGTINSSFIYIFLMLLSMIPIIVVAGFREDVGVDYYNYVYSYYRIVSYNFFDSIGSVEIGHILLVKIAEIIFNSPEGLFLIYSIITITFLYLSLHRYRYSISIPIALMLYYAKYFAFSLNGVRQAAAMSIILFGLHYITKRELKKFTFFVLSASLFHTTALVIYPFYFIIGKQSNSKLYIKLLYLAISILIVIFIPSFINLISNIGFFSNYEYYANLSNEDGLNIYSVVTPIIILMSFFLIGKKLLEKKPEAELYIWMYLYGFVFSLISIQLKFVSRISLYFDVVSIILIPLILSVIRNKLLRVIIFMLVALYCLTVFILGNYITDGHQVIPYKFIWD